MTKPYTLEITGDLRQNRPDLSFYYAQFGPVLNVIRTHNPQSNIVLFFSEEAARRAKNHRFPGSIRISQYIRQTAKGEWGAAACTRIAGEGSPLAGTRTQQLERSTASTRAFPKIHNQGKLLTGTPLAKEEWRISSLLGQLIHQYLYLSFLLISFGATGLLPRMATMFFVL
jgi:hypothetical protein